ncbi:hypothetical protein V6U81_12065 [Micromonospora sp. CPCC 205711]
MVAGIRRGLSGRIMPDGWRDWSAKVGRHTDARFNGGIGFHETEPGAGPW